MLPIPMHEEQQSIGDNNDNVNDNTVGVDVDYSVNKELSNDDIMREINANLSPVLS